MYKHILIPTDGSELSEHAVREGIAFAKSIGASATLFTASPSYHVFALDPVSLSDTEDSYKSDAASRASKRLKTGEDLARQAGVPVDSEHSFGDHPHEEILACANRKPCDLIFMASHGRKGMAGLLLGSETHKVLTHSKIPVMVYR